MNTNIKELRKEAYKLWGLGNQKVIFDFPRSPYNYNAQEFKFKLDFSDDKQSWPRAYAISQPNEQKSRVRVIMPIIWLKQYNNFNMEVKIWYDMPEFIHEVILTALGDLPEYKSLNLIQTIWNKMSIKKFKYTPVPTIEQCVFMVVDNGSEMMAKAIN